LCFPYNTPCALMHVQVIGVKTMAMLGRYRRRIATASLGRYVGVIPLAPKSVKIDTFTLFAPKSPLSG
jgi:hypothetical protein